MTSYSYSSDRQVWTGRFSSRQQAADVAIANAMSATLPPDTVYVGQRIEPDLRTYGHARSVIDTMRRRVREDNGDIADAYLRGVADSQVADLDRAMEAVIIEWLGRSGLDPNWVRIEAVSQYPMPVATQRQMTTGTDREVADLGVADSTPN